MQWGLRPVLAHDAERLGGIPTRSVETRRNAVTFLVPTLGVGIFSFPRSAWECSGDALRPVLAHDAERLGGIPTPSVGTRKNLLVPTLGVGMQWGRSASRACARRRASRRGNEKKRIHLSFDRGGYASLNPPYLNLSFLSLEGLGNLTSDNPLNFNTSIGLERLPEFLIRQNQPRNRFN